MGGGASKEEKLEGTAVTGMWHKKVTFPPGVVGEKMPDGPSPGSKFLKTPPPRLLAELNAAKGTEEEYAELKAALVEECGGKKISGWKSKKVEEVVRRFQPRFNAKGVAVNYSMVKWWVSHGQSGGHMEYRYWLEYSDVDAVAQRVTGTVVGAVGADKVGDQADAPCVVDATVVDDGFDLRGEWRLDMDSRKGEAKTWFHGGEAVITRPSNVYVLEGRSKAGVMFVKWWEHFDCPLVASAEPNQYTFRIEGKEYQVTAVSASEITISWKKGSVQWTKLDLPKEEEEEEEEEEGEKPQV